MIAREPLCETCRYGMRYSVCEFGTTRPYVYCNVISKTLGCAPDNYVTACAAYCKEDDHGG